MAILPTIEVEDLAAIESCYERGWSDGLPVIPPSVDRVERFLACTSRPPEEIVGRLFPSGRAATVASIAANGVMAGCLPEAMPLLVAATEAIADPAFCVEGATTSVKARAPLMIVNGPVRDRLQLNSGRNVLA